MPPIRLTPPSGRYLSFVEREEIAIMNAVDCGVCEIARWLDRSPSRISPANYAATRPPVAAGWSIGPRSPSGRPSPDLATGSGSHVADMM